MKRANFPGSSKTPQSRAEVVFSDQRVTFLKVTSERVDIRHAALKNLQRAQLKGFHVFLPLQHFISVGVYSLC